jgi:hypothetical protein
METTGIQSRTTIHKSDFGIHFKVIYSFLMFE